MATITSLPTGAATKKGKNNKSSPALSSTSSPNGKNKTSDSLNKPVDSRFTQQNLPAWQPILTPYNVIPGLIFIALTFISMGVFFIIKSNSLIEIKIPINGFGQKKIKHTFPYMKGPVYQYFELENFYQNELSYTKSIDFDQMGDPNILLDADCLPPGTNAQKVFPCGLIANSYLLDGPVKVGSIEFSSKDISWPKDKQRYYDGKNLQELKEGYVFPPKNWTSEGKNPLNLVLWDDDRSYKSYPSLADMESFINWVRIAGLPTFRKLYGKYGGNIEKGEYEITFESNSQYPSAKKYIVFSNLNWIGGKNPQLGYTYCVTGIIFLSCGLFFLLRHWRMPKNLSDKKKLSWLQITESFDDLRKNMSKTCLQPADNDLIESFGGAGAIGIEGEPEVMMMLPSDTENSDNDSEDGEDITNGPHQ